jgi:hypothetical protein
MKRIGVLAAAAAVLFTAVWPVFAHTNSDSDPMSNLGVGITLPSFDVRMSMGFNYDLLRSLTAVSFDYPVGLFALNLPFGAGNLLPQSVMDDVFSDTGLFRRPENFRPTAGASQNANTTVRVDVPMLNGVGTFAYTQNFSFNMNTALGGSSVISAFQDIGELMEESDMDADVGGFLSLRGALRLPLSVSMGWETMTFGYAYRVNNNDNLVFALNLHRHLFAMDMRLRADIDLLGHVNLRADNVDMGGDGTTISMALSDDLINFSSEVCNGSAQGRYRAEAWTPSIGARWGRFSADLRFGLNVRAKGSAQGGFVVPRIVNLETGDIDLLDRFEGFADSLAENPAYVFDLLSDESGLIPREVDSVYYDIRESMRWKMPTGLTVAFDIIPRRFSVSYSTTFGGEINLKIDEVVRTTSPQANEPGSWLDGENDTLSVDLGVRVDHIIMFHLNYPSFYINLGICGLDARSGDSHALKELSGLPRIGDVVMIMPVLSGGLSLGTRLQLQLEANILPLPAVRTGVKYYF